MVHKNLYVHRIRSLDLFNNVLWSVLWLPELVRAPLRHKPENPNLSIYISKYLVGLLDLNTVVYYRYTSLRCYAVLKSKRRHVTCATHSIFQGSIVCNMAPPAHFRQTQRPTLKLLLAFLTSQTQQNKGRKYKVLTYICIYLRIILQLSPFLRPQSPLFPS
jgi:hypothetical protein